MSKKDIITIAGAVIMCIVAGLDLVLQALPFSSKVIKQSYPVKASKYNQLPGRCRLR